MSHPFDTLGFSQKLVEAGMDPEEAALSTALIAAAITEATTAKADEAKIDAKLAELRSEVRREIAEAKVDILKWVVGIGLTQVAALVGLVYALLRLFPGGHP